MSNHRTSSIVKPMGDVHDFEPVVHKKEKPAVVTKKLSGDTLTSEKAIQYILNERQKMDIVYAQLRKENEALKDNMEKLQDHNKKMGIDSASVDNNKASNPFMSPKYEKPEKIHEEGVLNAEIEKLKRENEMLKEQSRLGRISPPSYDPGEETGHGLTAKPLSHNSISHNRAKSLPIPQQTSEGTAGAGVRTSAPGQMHYSSKVQLGTSLTNTTTTTARHQHQCNELTPERAIDESLLYSVSNAVCGKGKNTVINIADVLWEGLCLYKIPYNGKGSAERRLVFLKKADFLTATSRAVRIIDCTTNKKKEYLNHSSIHKYQYVAYPLTLEWMKVNDSVKNARSLVLEAGTVIHTGHVSAAFQKFAKHSSDTMPHPSVCFSVTVPNGKRTLDLAAETPREADVWKFALKCLLSVIYNEFNPYQGDGLLSPGKVVLDMTGSPSPPPAPVPASAIGLMQHSNSYNNRAMTSKDMKVSKEKLRNQLFMALKNNNFASFRSILKSSENAPEGSGVSINDMDPGTTDTPLMYACRLGYMDIVRHCLRLGAMNDPHPTFGETALHAAVGANQFEAASVILAEAARSEANVIIVNVLENNKQQTPLHYACANGSPDMIELLLNNGADLYVPDKFSMTPLHVVAKGGFFPCLAMLLDQGADSIIDAGDMWGYSVLHHAAENGHLACVRLLLETAADVNSQNLRGDTPYDVAQLAGYQQICMLIKEYGGLTGREADKERLTRRARQGPGQRQGQGQGQGQYPPPPQHGADISSDYEIQRAQTVRSSPSGYMYPESPLPRPSSNPLSTTSTPVPGVQGLISPSPIGKGNAPTASFYNVGKPVLNRGSSTPNMFYSPGPVTSGATESLPRPYATSTPNGGSSTNANSNNGMTSTPNPLLSPNPNTSFVTPMSTPAVRQPYNRAGQLQPHHQQQLSYASNGAGALSARGAGDPNPNDPRIAGNWHSPMTARERVKPSLFAGMTINKEGVNADVVDSDVDDADGDSAEGEGDGKPIPMYEFEEIETLQDRDGQGEGDEGGGDAAAVLPIERFMYEGVEWHQYVTEGGGEGADAEQHVYYLDMTTSHSQWDDPREYGIVRYDDQGNPIMDQAYARYDTQGMSPLPGRLPPKSPTTSPSYAMVKAQQLKLRSAAAGGGAVITGKLLFDGNDTDNNANANMRAQRKSKSHKKKDKSGSVLSSSTARRAKKVYSDEEFDSCYQRSSGTDTDSDGSESESWSGSGSGSGSDDSSSGPAGEAQDEDSGIDGENPKVRSHYHSHSHSRDRAGIAGSRRPRHHRHGSGGDGVETSSGRVAGKKQRRGHSQRGKSQAVSQDPEDCAQSDWDEDMPEMPSPAVAQKQRSSGNINNSSTSSGFSGPKQVDTAPVPNPIFIPVDGKYGTGGNKMQKESKEAVESKQVDAAAASVSKSTSGGEGRKQEKEQKVSGSVDKSKFGAFGAPAPAESKDSASSASASSFGGARAAAAQALAQAKKEQKEQKEAKGCGQNQRPQEYYISLLRDGESLRAVRKQMEENEETRDSIRALLNIADTIEVVAKPKKIDTNGPDVSTSGTGGNAAESQSPKRPTPSVPAETIAELKSDPVLGKFAKMAGMGVPAGSVQHKMQMENIDQANTNRMLRALGIEVEEPESAPVSVSVPTAKEETIAELKSDPVLGKFAKMAGMGVPAGSVQHKMQMENIDQTNTNRMLRALGIEVEEPESAPVSVSVPAAKEETIAELKSDPVLGKFAKMAGMGVPAGSVQHKMQMENIDQANTNRMLRALGILPPEIQTAAPGSVASGMSTARRSSVQLQKIHWSPLANDKLEKSIWGEVNSAGSSDIIGDEDVEEIEKLFRAAHAKPVASQGSDDGSASGRNSITALQNELAEKLKLHVLEGKRAQNITIGLAQYKSLLLAAKAEGAGGSGSGSSSSSSSAGATVDYNILFYAISTLDKLNNRLNIDHLENVVNLLPTPSEAKILFKAKNTQHPAELFMLLSQEYPHLQKRLNIFIICENLPGMANEAVEKAKLVITACNEILSNDKLAKILQRMLAIGNLMNQNQGAGGGRAQKQANGISLDSLVKMIQTKGVDKKTTILDYMVKSLLDKNEYRLLDITEDFELLDGCVKLSGCDILKDMEGIEKNFKLLTMELDRCAERKRESDGTAEGENEVDKTYRERLQMKTEQLSLQLSSVTRYQNIMRNKVTEAVEYFGEDTNGSCDTLKIFSTLHLFCKSIAASKVTVERRARSEARNNERSGGGGGRDRSASRDR